MNKSDSERAAAILDSIGYKETENEKEADLILVMACSVRQSAIDRIFGKAKNWRKRNAVLVLAGCVLPKDKPKMKKIFDVLIENNDLPKLPALLDKNCNNSPEFFKIKPRHKLSFSAFIPIMTGCDNFCTYCAVPLTKGREVSRPFDEILEEVNSLIKDGYKEIILLGQNVNSYGKDLKNKKHNFSDLLKEVDKVSGNFWIRFITSNPHDMSSEIIDAVAFSKKITEYIHLPIQAGSNEVLKKMNRKYTAKKYLSQIEEIRNKIPEASLSTDVIVGFPGETNSQFKDSVKIFEKVEYDMAYISQYSPREGTISAKMRDNISKKEKEKRDKILTDVLRKTALSKNEKYIGKTFTVLTDRKDKGYFLGRTRTFKLVQFKSNKNLIGKFIEVTIRSVTPWAMRGEIKK